MALRDHLPGAGARAAARQQYWDRRRMLREDVTLFGEQLAELHVDTLTDDLSGDVGDTYRQALSSYERAKRSLRDADTVEQLDEAARAVADGRYQRACVLAVTSGEPAPQRLAECFFNPQHGPSTTTVTWTPPGGVARSVEVCGADARRLEADEAPAHRLVRVGDRHVPMVLADLAPGYVAPVDRRAARDARREAVARMTMIRGADPGSLHSGAEHGPSGF